jgi:hypothetical protein
MDGRAKRSRFQPDVHLQHRPERPESAQHGGHLLLLHRRRSRLLTGRMVLVRWGASGFGTTTIFLGIVVKSIYAGRLDYVLKELRHDLE